MNELGEVHRHFPTLPEPDRLDAKSVLPGWNRASGACLIDAQSDAEAVTAWLKEFTKRPNTFASYRKEAERFLLWASIKRGKTLSSITRDDVLDYETFMEHPDPDWCGPTRPRHHPNWKPFAQWGNSPAGLSEASRRQAKIALGALFRYLIEAGFMQRNPFSLGRGRSTSIVQIHDDRLIEQDALTFLMGWLDAMPRDTPREIAHAERSRWIITLLYQSALRLREVVGSKMGNFRLIRGNWWIRVVGKGNKTADVPVTHDLLEALKRYRLHLGLKDLPTPSDTTPLVCAIWTRKDQPTGGVSATALHKIIKEVMRQASLAAQIAGKDGIAANLDRATAHWMRHSSASHQLDAGIPLLMVSQNLRHAKLETTRRYLHTEADERHAISQSWSKKTEK